jgi:hypothetical protein
MQSFKDFIKQPERKDPKSTTLHAFDIDETLFAHDHDHLKIGVRHKKTGEHIASLTNQEFNTHKLHPDHEYDFSQFRSSKTFEKSAKPIRSMISKLKGIYKNNKNVEMLTARADFDDKEHFAKHMSKFGLDIGKIHVRRAGNLGNGNPAKNKAKVVSALIKKHGYKKVHLYDDSVSNLQHFKALSKKHPDVEFHAHHVQHDAETGKTKVTKI